MKRYSADAGTTLLEVLVAIFVMGIGLLAAFVLFPLGALELAHSLKDDRTAAIAVNATALSEAGEHVLSETASFIEVSLKLGSVDAETAARLREKYAELLREAADIETQLEELQLIFPRAQIQRQVGPLLGQIRAIKHRLGAVIVLLSVVEGK